jgi:hypothetical protein
MPCLPAHCCSYRSNNDELFSFSVSDNLVAAGGQGNVLFWDRRTQQQLATFDDMHMDDVTQVGFWGCWGFTNDSARAV